MSAPSLDLNHIREVADTASPGPWVWRDFGSRAMLVTAHHGSRVVLAASRDGGIATRNEGGTLSEITPDHPVAILTASARTWVPALAIELEAERARITELEAEVARLRKWTAFRTDFLANPKESP